MTFIRQACLNLRLKIENIRQAVRLLPRNRFAGGQSSAAARDNQKPAPVREADFQSPNNAGSTEDHLPGRMPGEPLKAAGPIGAAFGELEPFK